MSSPIRSARASGPIGWFIPSVMTASMASASATPSMSAKTASLIIGARIRLETKPGKSRTSTGVFPSASATSTTVSPVASSVRSPRTTSTSFMTGTGFMKCIPTTRPGRDVRAAIAVIEIDDVLDARMDSGRRHPVQLGEDLVLESGDFGHGLHDQPGLADVLQSGRGFDAAEGPGHGPGVDPAPRPLPFQVAPDRGDAAIEGGGVRVHQDHLQPRQRAHVGDAVPHGPGADDRDSFDVHPFSLLRFDGSLRPT